MGAEAGQTLPAHTALCVSLMGIVHGLSLSCCSLTVDLSENLVCSCMQPGLPFICSLSTVKFSSATWLPFYVVLRSASQQPRYDAWPIPISVFKIDDEFKLASASTLRLLSGITAGPLMLSPSSKPLLSRCIGNTG